MAKFIWGIKNTLSKDPAVTERLSHLSDITFEYSEPVQEGKYSCFRIYIGKKFYIAKAKNFAWFGQNLTKLLKAYNSNGTDANDLYFPIIKHIHNTGYYDVRIEFICQSENPYEVIKAEYLALKVVFGTSLCLNKNNEPYTPIWNEKTKMFGWLTQNQFLNFKKLVKANS